MAVKRLKRRVESSDRKPVKGLKEGLNVVSVFGLEDETCRRVLNTLKFVLIGLVRIHPREDSNPRPVPSVTR